MCQSLSEEEERVKLAENDGVGDLTYSHYSEGWTALGTDKSRSGATAGASEAPGWGGTNS